MATALHFTLPQSSLHSAVNKLMLALGARNVALNEAGTNKVLRLNLVNAAWMQPGIDFVPAYLDTLAVEYGSGINLVDFGKDPVGATNLINAWIASKTEDKIQNLMPLGAIKNDTALVLTNALYFFGNWATPFAKSATFDAPFHAPAGDVTAAMMENTLSSSYAEGDGWKMAELFYTGWQVSMTIVLPEAGRLDEVRSAMSAGWLAESDSKAINSKVKFGLPKFRYYWGSESLTASLEALGIVNAFDMNVADFSGMATGLPMAISDVVHKAFMEVDEEGTEAAAATGVFMEAGADGGAPDSPKTLHADRPFLFLIRDRTTGAVLFIGQVADPSKSLHEGFSWGLEVARGIVTSRR